MSNYYTHACWILKTLTDAEQQWLGEQMEEVEHPGTLQADEGPVLCPRILVDYPQLELESPYFDFHIHTSAATSGIYLCIEDEDGILDTDKVTYFLQKFLQAFPDRRYATFEWAYGCDQAKSDAFGGGAAFITADEVKWENTTHWLQVLEKEFLDKWEADANLIPGGS